MIRLVAAAVADNREFPFKDKIEVVANRLADTPIPRRAKVFDKSFEVARSLVGLGVGSPHQMRRHLVVCHLHEVAPLRAAARNEIARKLKIGRLARHLPQPHKGLEERGGLHMVRAPSGGERVHLRRRTDLVDDAHGLPFERSEHGRGLLDPRVIVLQPQHHILAFPQVATVRFRDAVAARRLTLDRHAADRAVGTFGGKDVLHGGIENRLQLRIGRMAVLHGAGSDELAPHLAQRKLRTPLAEKRRKLMVGHIPLVPPGHALGDRFGQAARKPLRARRERGIDLKHSRIRRKRGECGQEANLLREVNQHRRGHLDFSLTLPARPRGAR